MTTEDLPDESGVEYFVRSDYLVHWTGHDFDPGSWYDGAASNTDEELTSRYIERLTNILKFGLWMTKDRNCGIANLLGDRDPSEAEVAKATPICCFTELKLSESRRHAKQYGRLGIAVKRPFVFDRGGRPVTYFGFAADHRMQPDPFREACFKQLSDPRLLNYFKPMNGPPKRKGPMEYELYSEAEWRIVFQEKFLTDEANLTPLIVDPRSSKNPAASEYLNSLDASGQSGLRYLLPLGGWFAMLIYPSRRVKQLAQESDEIRKLIELTRGRGDRGNHNEGDWPIELTLDACRHF